MMSVHALPALHSPDVVIFTEGPATAVSFLRKLPTVAAKPWRNDGGGDGCKATREGRQARQE